MDKNRKRFQTNLNTIFNQDPRDIHFEFRALTIELLSANKRMDYDLWLVF